MPLQLDTADCELVPAEWVKDAALCNAYRDATGRFLSASCDSFGFAEPCTENRISALLPPLACRTQAFGNIWRQADRNGNLLWSFLWAASANREQHSLLRFWKSGERNRAARVLSR